MSVPDEAELWRALSARPDDRAVRERYAAVLAEHDPIFGQLFALTRAMASASAEELPAMLARREALERQLGSELDQMRWRMLRDDDVRNCGLGSHSEPEVRFAFRCPRTWESFSATDQDEVRHCAVCNRHVYQVSSREEIAERARRGECISVPRGVASVLMYEGASTATGRPDPVQLWGRQLLRRDE